MTTETLATKWTETIVKSATVIWGVGNIEGPFAFLANVGDAHIVAAQFSTPGHTVRVFPFVVYSCADAYLLAHAQWVKSKESLGAEF